MLVNYVNILYVPMANESTPRSDPTIHLPWIVNPANHLHKVYVYSKRWVDSSHTYNFWYLHRFMCQTYFECYEFVISTLYSYSLQPVLINQCCSEYEWFRVVEFPNCRFTHAQNYTILMSSEKKDSLLISAIYVAKWYIRYTSL